MAFFSLFLPVCPRACIDPGQTCLSRCDPAIRCSFQRSSDQRSSSHRSRVNSTSGTSAASFVQHQFEPLPRLSCLICNRVSRPVAVEPPTWRSRWIFSAVGRHGSIRPSSHSNRSASISRRPLVPSVDIVGHPAALTRCPENAARAVSLFPNMPSVRSLTP